MSTLAPRLRHLIAFLAPVSTRDEDGRVIQGWVTATLPDGAELVNVPAEVLTGAGREFNASGAVQSELAARITCRWFPGLDASWCVSWEGALYGVASIETDMTGRREYRLRCTAGPSRGL